MSTYKTSIIISIFIQIAWSWPDQKYATMEHTPYNSPTKPGQLFISKLRPLLNGEYRIVADVVHIDAIPIKHFPTNPMSLWMQKPAYPIKLPVINYLDHTSIKPFPIWAGNHPNHFQTLNIKPNPNMIQRPIPSIPNRPEHRPNYFQAMGIKPDPNMMQRPVINYINQKPLSQRPDLFVPVIKPSATPNQGMYIRPNVGSIKPNTEEYRPELKTDYAIPLTEQTPVANQQQLNHPFPAQSNGDIKFSWNSKNENGITVESLLKEYQALEQKVGNMKEIDISAGGQKESFGNKVSLEQLLDGYKKLQEQIGQQSNGYHAVPKNTSARPSHSTFQPSSTRVPKYVTTTSSNDIETSKTTEHTTLNPKETTTVLPEITTKLNEKSTTPTFTSTPLENSHLGNNPFESSSSNNNLYSGSFSLGNPFGKQDFNQNGFNEIPFQKENASGHSNGGLPSQASNFHPATTGNRETETKATATPYTEGKKATVTIDTESTNIKQTTSYPDTTPLPAKI